MTGNKAFYLMPMCVENIPFPVRKKMRTKKENPFSTHFCYGFMYVVYETAL